MNTLRSICIPTLALALLCAGCDTTPGQNGTSPVDSLGSPVHGDWVRIWFPSDPDNLNPVTHLSATSSMIIEVLNPTLYTFDPVTLEAQTQLAVSMAQVSDDGLSFTFEITPEAQWDNGTPITAKDYEFGLKAIMNPLVEPATRRLFYNFISDLKIDPANPRKFTVFINQEFFQAEYSLGGIDIIPEYAYDPKGLMKDIPLADLIANPDKYKKDPKVKQFAEEFMSEKYASSPEGVVGGGPYRLEEWIEGDHITLVRKENWWGEKLLAKNWSFQAWPDKLIYKVIPDRKTAVAALKSGELDVMGGMSEKEFLEMRDAGNSDFNLYSPTIFSYSLLTLNTRPIPGRHKVLNDKNVRKALAHVVDTKRIIDELYLGFGEQMVGPVLPANKTEVHPTLKPVEYNPEKAKELLAQSGWKDTNGDGTLDKVVDGKHTELVLEFMISEGSNKGADMVQVVKDECAKVGIKIEGKVLPLEKAMELTRRHQFDIFGISYQGHHLAPDLYQNWSTDQWSENGSNITGFGNAESDSIINRLRVEKDKATRIALYHRIQEMIYEEQPAIFMRVPKDRIAIHKRFQNANATSLRPGYKPYAFWVPKDKQKFK